jgi:hypothetical protein
VEDKTLTSGGWYADKMGEGGSKGLLVEEWLARIIHDDSSRNRAVAKRDRCAEPRGLAPPSDFGEIPSTGSGPELVEGSRAAAVLSRCSSDGYRRQEEGRQSPTVC